MDLRSDDFRAASSDDGDAVDVPLLPFPLPGVPVRADAELRYEVVEGRVVVQIAALTRTYRAGEIFIVPLGVLHAMEPADGDRVRVLRRSTTSPHGDTR